MKRSFRQQAGTRPGVIILGGLFLGLCTWWVFYVPYAPLRLHAVIPPGATFVSVHEGLGERWHQPLGNPVVQAGLHYAGVDLAEVYTVARSAQYRAWSERLASARTIVAYAPRYGRFGHPAWVFASWVGGDARKLQWLAEAGSLPGVEAARVDGGLVFYRVPAASHRGSELSIAIADGMLIGCFTSDRDGVLRLLERSFPGTPVSPTFRWVDATARDRVRFLWRDPWADRLAPRNGELRLDRADAGQLSGTAYLEYPWPSSPLLAEGDARFLRRLLGRAPEAFAILPFSRVMRFLPPQEGAIWSHVTRPLATRLDGEGDPTVFAAMVGGEFKSRVGRGMAATLGLGLPVPTLLVGLRIRHADAVPGAAAAVVDRLNAHYHLGLLPHRISLAGREAYRLDSLGSDAYAELDERERVAWMVIDDWLVLSSQAEVLGQVAERYARPESVASIGDGQWTSALPQGAAGCLWIDPERVDTSMGNLLAIASLFVDRDRAEGRELREQLDTARAALRGVRDVGPAHAILFREASERLRMEVAVGAN